MNEMLTSECFMPCIPVVHTCVLLGAPLVSPQEGNECLTKNQRLLMKCHTLFSGCLPSLMKPHPLTFCSTDVLHQKEGSGTTHINWFC